MAPQISNCYLCTDCICTKTIQYKAEHIVVCEYCHKKYIKEWKKYLGNKQESPELKKQFIELFIINKQLLVDYQPNHEHETVSALMRLL